MSLLANHTFYTSTRPSTAGRASSKKSIYDPPVVVLERQLQPLPLVQEIHDTRVELTKRYSTVVNAVSSTVEAYFAFEAQVKKTTRNLLESTAEPLIPHGLYVVVAGMGGSILARNRGLFSRFLLPPTTAVLASAYFMPRTTLNLATHAMDRAVGVDERKRYQSMVESQYKSVLELPGQVQKQTKDSYERAVKMADETVSATVHGWKDAASKAIQEATSSVKKSVSEGVQEAKKSLSKE